MQEQEYESEDKRDLLKPFHWAVLTLTLTLNSDANTEPHYTCTCIIVSFLKRKHFQL